MSNLDFDLSCSEVSADLSPYLELSSDLHYQESCLMEYRLLSVVEAQSELQWLLETEQMTWRYRPRVISAESESQLRRLLVDTLCVVRLQFVDKFCARSSSWQNLEDV